MRQRLLQARQEDREAAMGFYAKNENGEVVDLKKGTRSRCETLELGDQQKERLMDSIVEAHSQEKCIERLVADYFKSGATLDDKLVLAHSRAEVGALNAGIRKEKEAMSAVSEGELKAARSLEVLKLAVRHATSTVLPVALTDSGTIFKQGMVR
ncbi:hypothetical protein [Stenotrophomonas maltophilia]|jgi:hypothetical protein|nr:hypothetical protein [Stenotrophomonas maltophilia]